MALGDHAQPVALDDAYEAPIEGAQEGIAFNFSRDKGGHYLATGWALAEGMFVDVESSGCDHAKTSRDPANEVIPVACVGMSSEGGTPCLGGEGGGVEPS